MLVRTIAAASLALIASAAPAPASSNPYAYSPALAAFYSAVSKQITALKSTSTYKSNAATCDMVAANANFPSAPSPLGAPDEGSSLRHVLLGMGVQNYTCPDTLTPSAAPTAIGAYANLFNVSCIAANYPDILATLPGLAYQYQLPSQYFPPAGTVGQSAAVVPTADFSYQPLNVVFSGIHTFYNTTTPRFDLQELSPGFNNGLVLAQKAASVAAWPNATVGPGTVPYLKLNAIAGTLGGYTNVYRMETQGGMQPTTCSNNTGVFSVPYSGTYWFYGK